MRPIMGYGADAMLAAMGYDLRAGRPKHKPLSSPGMTMALTLEQAQFIATISNGGLPIDTLTDAQAATARELERMGAAVAAWKGLAVCRWVPTADGTAAARERLEGLTDGAGI